jgi:hypothetical protein
MNKKKVYFLYPVEVGPKVYRQDMERVYDQLNTLHADLFTVETQPKNMRTFPPKELAEEVLRKMSECDVLVCDVSHLSIFVGMVVGLMNTLHKPLLLIYAKNNKPQIESFVFTVPTWHKWVLLESYQDFNTIAPTIREGITRLSLSKKPV